MNFEELKTKVEEWAEDKDLLHSENADKQLTANLLRKKI